MDDFDESNPYGIKLLDEKKQDVDHLLKRIEDLQDLRKFFVIIFVVSILTICYGVGMFYAGRAAEPTPDPQIYVVNESEISTTTVP